MKSEEIKVLARKGLWQEKPLQAKLTETHISWVLLGKDCVFKIKKPLKFSFLDFSSLEKRQHFCKREVELNSRLCDIYLDVVAIYQEKENYFLGKNHSEPVEYAVLMKRIDSDLEMDKMLDEKRVTNNHIRLLAEKIATFHQKAKVIDHPFDIHKMAEDFNDLLSVKEKIENRLGKEAGKLVSKAINFSNSFLKSHQPFIKSRTEQGFRRDLHGDFHSGNIFLTKDPIIFDCIEFNDHFRQVDILDEIAFFCMDLEAHGQNELSQKFLNYYQIKMGIHFSGKELALFNFYKLYRANVRAKVNTLNPNSDPDSIRSYLDLIAQYCS